MGRTPALFYTCRQSLTSHHTPEFLHELTGFIDVCDMFQVTTSLSGR